LLDLDDESLYEDSLAWALCPFFQGSTEWLGNGETSSKIVSILKERL